MRSACQCFGTRPQMQDNHIGDQDARPTVDNWPKSAKMQFWLVDFSKKAFSDTSQKQNYSDYVTVAATSLVPNELDNDNKFDFNTF